MQIALGCDHAGFGLKKDILEVIQGLKFEVVDCGTGSKESVDYPDFAAKVSELVSSGKMEKGILICGTGIGMSIVANKYPNIRAALCNDLFTAQMSRRHNDANILAIGGRIVGRDLAREIVRVWLTTPFDGDRHSRRLEKIHQIERDVKSCGR